MQLALGQFEFHVHLFLFLETEKAHLFVDDLLGEHLLLLVLLLCQSLALHLDSLLVLPYAALNFHASFQLQPLHLAFVLLDFPLFRFESPLLGQVKLLRLSLGLKLSFHVLFLLMGQGGLPSLLHLCKLGTLQILVDLEFELYFLLYFVLNVFDYEGSYLFVFVSVAQSV